MKQYVFESALGDEITFRRYDLYHPLFVDGLGDPPSTDETESAPDQDGTTYIKTTYQARPVTIQGKISTLDTSSLLAARKALIKAFNKKAGIGTFTYIDEEGTAVILKAKPVSIQWPNRQGKEQQFLISLMAYDPYIYDEQMKTQSLGGWGGGLEFAQDNIAGNITLIPNSALSITVREPDDVTGSTTVGKTLNKLNKALLFFDLSDLVKNNYQITVAKFRITQSALQGDTVEIFIHKNTQAYTPAATYLSRPDSVSTGLSFIANRISSPLLWEFDIKDLISDWLKGNFCGLKLTTDSGIQDGAYQSFSNARIYIEHSGQETGVEFLDDEVGGGIELEIISSGYSDILANDGDESTPVDIMINGPASYALITNITTGKQIYVNVSIGETEQLHISTNPNDLQVQKYNIMTGIWTNAFDALSEDSDLSEFVLEPGDNEISFDSSAIQGNSTVSISWRDRRPGV